MTINREGSSGRKCGGQGLLKGDADGAISWPVARSIWCALIRLIPAPLFHPPTFVHRETAHRGGRLHLLGAGRRLYAQAYPTCYALSRGRQQTQPHRLRLQFFDDAKRPLGDGRPRQNELAVGAPGVSD